MAKYIDQATIDEFREKIAKVIIFSGDFDDLTGRQARAIIDQAAKVMVAICTDYGWIDPSLVRDDDQEPPS